MHKHHNFRTGIVLSVTLLVIIIAIIIFENFYITEKAKPKKNYDIALITDYNTDNDNSYSESAKNAIKTYCSKNSMTYKLFTPESNDIEDTLATIDKAAKNHVHVIICCSSALSEAVYQAQGRYPDISFFLLNGEPINDDGSVSQIDTNVMPVTFDDDEAGFMAGYTVVKSGFNRIAIFYDSNKATDMHHMYGFIQGADYAAKEDRTKPVINCKNIANSSEEDIKKYSEKLYKKNTQIIFCNNDITTNIINPIAQNQNKYIINFGMDLTKDSDVVFSSFCNNISSAVARCLTIYNNGEFKGGETSKMDFSNVGFNFIFNDSLKYEIDDNTYEKMNQMLSNNTLTIITDTTVEISDLELKNVKVKSK